MIRYKHEWKQKYGLERQNNYRKDDFFFGFFFYNNIQKPHIIKMWSRETTILEKMHSFFIVYIIKKGKLDFIFFFVYNN